MANRTQYNVQDVLRLLGDEAGRGVTRNQVVRVMGQVQEDLCRENLAIRFEGTLTLTAALETYDVNGNVWKVEEFIEPAAWTEEVTILHDAKVWKEKRRTTFDIAQPIYGIIIDRWLHLWPLPPTTGDEVGIIGYALPEVTLTEAADPEVGSQWDRALVLGTVGILAPQLTDGLGLTYEQKYERERERQGQISIKESIAGPLRRESSSDTLLF